MGQGQCCQNSKNKQIEIIHEKQEQDHRERIDQKENEKKQIDHIIKKISVADQSNQVCDMKLIAAKQYAKALSSFIHSNILKYVDEYQIETNYYVKIQKCFCSFSYFIKNNQQAISQQQYIQFGLQLIDAIQYLHKNNCFLRYISLTDILIDTNQQIKIYDFDLEQNIRSHEIFELIEQKANDNNFFFPPEIYKLSDEECVDNSYFYRKEGDIWLFGIFMYILAGSSYQDAEQLARGVQSFKDLKSISLSINQILLNILKIKPEKRPSIDYIKIWFKNFSKINSLSEQELFQQVKQCFDQFEFKISIIYLEKLIEMRPLNDQYIAVLGKAYIEIQKLDESFDQSLKCLQINPKNDLSLCNLAYYYYMNNNTTKSLEYIDQCLSINPNNYFALNYKAYIQSSYGKYKEAIEIHEQAFKLNPNYVHALNGIGKIYYNQNKFKQALCFYEKSLSINPNFYYSYLLLAQAYQGLEMHDIALENFQKALEIEPNCRFSLEYFGDYYKQLRNWNLAIKYYKKSTKVNPKLSLGFESIGLIYSETYDFTKATKYFKKHLLNQPNSRFTNRYLGQIYEQRGQYSIAIYYFKQQIKINPQYSPDSYKTLGKLYFYEKQYNLSLDILRQYERQFGLDKQQYEHVKRNI